jgi:hypothetical protein
MYSSSNLPILVSTIIAVNALPQYQGRNVEGEASVEWQQNSQLYLLSCIMQYIHNELATCSVFSINELCTDCEGGGSSAEDEGESMNLTAVILLRTQA